MTGGLLSTGLDVLVLIFLGITIYYAIRLTKSLNSFRAYRAEFDKLLDELTRNVTDAQRAIHNLKIASGDAGKGLDKIVRESKSLISELEIINESGRTLADRLEGLLDKNRSAARAQDRLVSARRPVAAGGQPAFAIRDPDLGASPVADWPDEDEADDPEEGGDIPEYLQSQAEQELYKALRKGRKLSGGRLS